MPTILVLLPHSGYFKVVPSSVGISDLEYYRMMTGCRDRVGLAMMPDKVLSALHELIDADPVGSC